MGARLRKTPTEVVNGRRKGAWAASTSSEARRRVEPAAVGFPDSCLASANRLVVLLLGPVSQSWVYDWRCPEAAADYDAALLNAVPGSRFAVDAHNCTRDQDAKQATARNRTWRCRRLFSPDRGELRSRHHEAR